MAVIQYYGIKYPFTAKDNTKTFVDLDSDASIAIKSDIIHIIFTPKGQRIRDPEFGTNLIKFIFNPNDNESWADIKDEIKSAVSKSVPNVTLKEIEIYEEQNYGIIAKIQYDIDKGAFISEETIITKL